MIRPSRVGMAKAKRASIGLSSSLMAVVALGLAQPAYSNTPSAVTTALSTGTIAAQTLTSGSTRRTADPDPARALAALERLISAYEVHLRRHDPITAGMEGDIAALSRLPDISRRNDLIRRRQLQGLVRQAQAINPDALDHESKLNLAYVQYLAQREVEAISLDTSRLSFDSEGGAHQLLAYLATQTQITTEAEGQAWLNRLRAAPALLAASAANTRRGLQTGMVQSRSVVESAMGQARRDLEAPIEADVLYQPLVDLPDSLTPDQQARLRQRARALISGPITQARRHWLDLLETQYLPKAPHEPGLVHRPGGRELYAFKVRSHTTSDITPEQVHAIGLEEVARIRALMDVEMRASGWTGSFADFLTFLRTDPQFYAQSRDELMAAAAEIASRADAALPSLFGTLPQLTYEVRPVPQEVEATYTTGRYSAGSLQNGVPGAYLVNTGRLDQRPLYELPALTVHEAVPGHHLQVALQQEAAAQPYYRRGANVTAFSEGWGLYAEYLGEEMGIYRTAYERFGRLSYEMWRACRLVADTGLHWYGWDIEQARACFRDNSALSPHNIETELQRYISDPGQATAYKIGEIHLKGLRQRARSELGPRFSLSQFHDRLLTHGGLPLYLLDIDVNIWIASLKTDH